MKKITILLAFIFLAISQLQAQVNSEVEVTKAYIPQVERAEKPLLKAIIADTAYISPDVDYSITPLSINTQLQTKPINPATVTYWEFNKPALAQVKVGGGFPLNSLLQAYGSSHNASVGYFAASIDHRGNYSNIENMSGDAVNATQTLNSADLAAGLYIAGHELKGEFSYDYDLYNNYAFVQTLSPEIRYQRVGGAVSFGDNFVDLTSLNYNVGVGYSSFFDHDSNANNRLKIDTKIGKEIDLGKLIFNADYKTTTGADNYTNQAAKVAAQLETSYQDWQIRAGVEYHFDMTELNGVNKANNYFIPQLLIHRSTKSIIQPFAELGGGVWQNSFEQLSTINPYIYGGAAAKSSVEYNLLLGAMGQTTSATLSYKLYAGYKIGLNTPYWALNVVEEPSYSATDIYCSYFVVESSSLNQTSINAEVDYSPFTNLALSLDAHCYAYSNTSSAQFINSRPNYNINLEAEYLLRRFRVALAGDIVGQRNYTMQSYAYLSSLSPEVTDVSLPAVLDLSLCVEYQHDNNMSFFVEGANLCNANLYPFPLYRGFGAQVSAGVKISFK